mmetsp:Transcript_12835/g.26190  ORF Transcript_12835/g.26190 Transcript_12835/m.26190 type:complete len:317 (+) Transcript_12835:127-1077(+)
MSAIRSLLKTKRWDDAIEKMREKPTDCKVKGTQDMNYILHEATINQAPLKVIQVLIDINPSASNKKDRAKMLPIEYAMKHSEKSTEQKEVVNFLLKYSPGAALKQIDKVFKSNRKRRDGPGKKERRRRTLDSLPSTQTPSPIALEKLRQQQELDSLDAALADITSLSKSSPVLDPIPISPPSSLSPPPQAGGEGKDSQVIRPMKRRSSFTQRIMSLFTSKKEEVDQDIDLTRGPSAVHSVGKKDMCKRLSFSSKDAMANMSSVKGLDLSNGAMEFGEDTPIEVLAALASLHKEGGGGGAQDEQERRKRRSRRRRSI